MSLQRVRPPNQCPGEAVHSRALQCVRRALLCPSRRPQWLVAAHAQGLRRAPQPGGKGQGAHRMLTDKFLSMGCMCLIMPGAKSCAPTEGACAPTHTTHADPMCALLAERRAAALLRSEVGSAQRIPWLPAGGNAPAGSPGRPRGAAGDDAGTGAAAPVQQGWLLLASGGPRREWRRSFFVLDAAGVLTCQGGRVCTWTRVHPRGPRPCASCLPVWAAASRMGRVCGRSRRRLSVHHLRPNHITVSLTHSLPSRRARSRVVI